MVPAAEAEISKSKNLFGWQPGSNRQRRDRTCVRSQ
jgi:hypothetical protein